MTTCFGLSYLIRPSSGQNSLKTICTQVLGYGKYIKG